MMTFDFDMGRCRYPSRRAVVFGSRGMVATGQPLAAQAGLEILKRGGNAVDAAVATAACLTVVEPTSNGIGGDCFARGWADGRLHGLNASGPAPMMADAEALRSAGWESVPELGWPSVTVPGAPAGWEELLRRFGRMELADVLAPAIAYARDGSAVSPTVALLWRRARGKYPQDGLFAEWHRTFCPAGRSPEPGETSRLPDHARTLMRMAERGASDLYRGELADEIDAFSSDTGGWIRKEDLVAFTPQWVEPISTRYRGLDVWELPPNGQGVSALMALKILDGLDLPRERESDETYHLQIEALKLALTDARAHVADPSSMTCAVEDMLADAYVAARRALIGREASDPAPGHPARGGTVYLATADGEGGMVSMIQSNYMGFGSGLVVPGTGIALHDRGACASLDPASPNVLAPGKRPYHTIIPGFLTHGGEQLGPFGVMGGYMQPQGHVQVVSNLVDFGMGPQEALDAPRWQWTGGRKILVEGAVPREVVDGLIARGHEARIATDSTTFGRGQIILRTPHGTLMGATEPRTDGHVAVW